MQNDKMDCFVTIATGYAEGPPYSAGSWKNVKGPSTYFVILEGGYVWRDIWKKRPTSISNNAGY